MDDYGATCKISQHHLAPSFSGKHYAYTRSYSIEYVPGIHIVFTKKARHDLKPANFASGSMDPYRKLCEVIPAGVNSAARAFPGLGRPPLIVSGAKDDCLIDLEERRLIDFCCAWGSLIHGHTPAPILKAVSEQLERGTSYGVTTLFEEKLARKVVKMMPSIEQVRFVSSGTEATMSALRLARGYTGRDKIVKFIGNYHGHADYLLVEAGSGVATHSASSAGVPDDFIRSTLVYPYNEPVKLSDDIAAVIVEPIAGNMGVVPAHPEFLQNLRQETMRVGALLIFDEVITGFRIGPGGAQELYNITPDLTCLGKIVGGGFPAAAFGGRREIMQQISPLGPVYQAGTLSGNPVAMVAGLKTLELLTPEFYRQLEEKTARFLKPFNCTRVGSMFSFPLTKEEFKPFFWSLFDAGIYISPSHMESCFLSAAHTEEHLQYTQEMLVLCQN